MTLFDKSNELGGQLNMAKQVPGKEEFFGLVEWYKTMVAKSSIEVRLETEATASMLAAFDEIVIATGVAPRDTQIDGQNGPNVLSYNDVLRGRAPVGKRVAIIGAGGIGFDVAEFLTTDDSPTVDLDAWMEEWGVTDPAAKRGGLSAEGPQPEPAVREVTLLQRKSEKLGKRLGKTTGWIHRATLQMKGVKMIGGVNYEQIDAQGLHVSDGEARENPRVIEVDTVVMCAGQVPMRKLADELEKVGRSPHVIGGADVAAELDAKRAINQGTRLAAAL